MSRIGKKPVKLEKGVTVSAAGNRLSVAGPKGSLEMDLPPGVTWAQQGDAVCFSADTASAAGRRFLGLARSLLQGMVTGVTAGYRKDLQIEGVGFRGQVAGQKLTISLGFSHPVVFEVPAGVKVTMADQTKIAVEGIDKRLVGEVAAQIRRFRPPDAYKGKGVRYAGEKITLKEGKTVG
jgi:large subunit ribosomal protein L6